MFQKLKNKPLLINLLVIVFFLVLPYYIFQGKLYIGGDDTRLMYPYPIQYLRNVVFFSWSNFSAVGSDSPTQLIAPFLGVWSLLSLFVKSKIVLDYLSFSLPFIIAFVFFQKFLGEIVDSNKNQLEIFAGSLFFVLSPILIINQYFIFLTTVWSLGLIFISMYYFVKYLKTSDFTYIFKQIIWATFLSLSFFSIPWLLGFMGPLFLGLISISFYFSRKEITRFIKKFIVFFGVMVLSQGFWLLGLILSTIQVDQNSAAGKVVNPGYISTFEPTINSTAIGNIFYPLLNLFHRQIALSFGWKLTDVFTSFYDKIIFLNLVFLVILIVGVRFYRKYFSTIERRVYLLFLISFVSTLFLFTVNIGPLKQLYIWFGHIPGFVMFRNFYDKFAPSYVINYSVLITLSLIAATRRYKKWSKHIITAFIFVVIINFVPVRPTVSSALWTTQSVYKNINIPDEYLGFMSFIKDNISPTNTILSVPFGTSIYTVIKDDKTNNVYLGTSPVKIFSGVNDMSGHLSFNFTREATDEYKFIISKDTKGFNKFLYDHNINYVAVTKNVPQEVLRSWVYDSTMLKAMNGQFIKDITSKKVYTSSKGNYDLYTTKLRGTLIKSDNTSFQKINQTKYKILVQNLKKQNLIFNDSYNVGWKLYLVPVKEKFNCDVVYKNSSDNTKECKDNFSLIEGDELSYLFRKPLFQNTQKIYSEFGNQWTIDRSTIKKAGPKYYTQNPDGSINTQMVLYFEPQLHLYLGAIISALTIISSGLYVLYLRIKKNEKK